MRKAKLLVVSALVIASHAQAEVIDIRFVVTDSLASSPTVAQTLSAYVEQLNGYYRNSQVDLQAEIVGIDFAPIKATEAVDILHDMAQEQHGFTGMFEKARQLGADYTIAVSDKLLMHNKPGCGRAIAVNQSVADLSSTRKAFAVVNIACGAHTLAHELGHLMGLNHGHLVARCAPAKGHSAAITPYANGYGEGNCDGKPQSGEFGDIMVGGWMREINGNGKSSLPFFSNPRIQDQRCGEKKQCGDAAIGDAARALNEHAHYYAGHEQRAKNVP